METYNYILKKYNINVGKQHVVEIPNMGRGHLAELFAELEFKKGIEVGVDQGKYSEILCKANPQAELFGIDPWSSSAYEPNTYVNEKQGFFDGRYEETIAKLAPYKNYTFIRKTSLEAMDDFEDNSLDFVYVDANHDFVNVARDLHGWNKKVRPGGILAGHDYAYFPFSKFNHVKRVLEVYARCYNIVPYFVVGVMNYDVGVDRPTSGRDKYRSWFWVKRER